MYKILVALILLQLPCIAVAKDCVVLLHGLARSIASMSPLEKELNQAGYLVVNQAYASRKKTIEELSVTAISSAKLACDGAKSIHFVTHSMGGILVRYYLSKNNINNPGNL